jgi:hypothetical protein
MINSYINKMTEAISELPAPMLRKFSSADIAEFLNARQAYERALEDRNSILRANQRITGRSIRASIDPPILEMICEMELAGEDPALVSDETLKSFFSTRAGVILRKTDATLSSIFKQLHFDLKISDAADRVADLWSQWYAVRKKYDVVKEFNTERGRKLFRKEMVEHFWPNAVKERVKRKLEGLDLEADE